MNQAETGDLDFYQSLDVIVRGTPPQPRTLPYGHAVDEASPPSQVGVLAIVVVTLVCWFLIGWGAIRFIGWLFRLLTGGI